MDLIDGIPDWLTCGAVILAGTGVLQLLQTWCDERLRQIDRHVARWRSTQPGLQDAGLAYAPPDDPAPGRRDPPPRLAA